jgi:hypothetical protein
VKQAVGLVAVLAVLGLGVWGLLVRFQTQEIATATGTSTIVTFEIVDRGTPATGTRAARALWSACTVDLGPSPVGELEAVTADGDRYRGALSPALDQFESQELRGCLNDLILPHVRGTAVRIQSPGGD